MQMNSKSKRLLQRAAAPVLLSALVSLPVSAMEADLELVADGLTAPLLLQTAPDGTKRQFIIEQIGLIKILNSDGSMADEPFLNIRHKLVELGADFDEQGLLGMAFHPDYKNNGKFYISYSAPVRGDAGLGEQLWYAHTNVVAEYNVSSDDPNKADKLSERILMQSDWPQFNHNGHWIGFGPDGMLYISMGDGGYANDWGIGHHVTKGNGQDMQSLMGKILRIDVNGDAPYGIPADNPFVGNDEALPEIWAYGFRNPWRCSFDMGGDNSLFCGDVGQNSFEEIDIVTAGGNYGWRAKEGNKCFDYVNPNAHPDSCDIEGAIDPIVQYNNCNVTDDCKGISVTGGYVYRGANAEWDGAYIFGDWSKSFAVKDGQLFIAMKDGDSWKMEDLEIKNIPGWNSYVLSFGQDEDGEVYIMATDTTGPVGGLDKIFKIVPAGTASAQADVKQKPLASN